MTGATDFENHAGKRMAIMHWGQTWTDGSGSEQPFYPSTNDLIRNAGYIPMMSWFSESGEDGANDTSQPSFQLSQIIGGTYDAYIRTWATTAQTWGHPFFLRFDHEMNGNWYPWSEQANGNEAGQYVTAWKHVHDIFTSVGATNVTWVWCVNIEGSGETSLSELYPGASYVDWVGIDGYNWGGTQAPDTWSSFSSLMSQTYADVGALAPGKPIMIVETASSETGGSKATWIEQMFQDLPTQFPKIRAFSWYDVSGPNQWPIESSTTAQQAFASGIASSYYLTNSSQYTSLPVLQPVPLP